VTRHRQVPLSGVAGATVDEGLQAALAGEAYVLFASANDLETATRRWSTLANRQGHTQLAVRLCGLHSAPWGDEAAWVRAAEPGVEPGAEGALPWRYELLWMHDFACRGEISLRAILRAPTADMQALEAVCRSSCDEA
jgi:hypothetical protein